MIIKSLLLPSVALTLLTLTACSTTPNMQQKLTPYLDQFIGKTSTEVKENIRLEQFNIQVSKKPIVDSNQAIVYRVLRPITIPLPTHVVTSTGSVSGGINMRPGSLAESYNVNFNCDIRFILKDDRVAEWSSSGRAC